MASLTQFPPYGDFNHKNGTFWPWNLGGYPSKPGLVSFHKLFGSSFSGIKVILQTCATWPFALQKEKAKPGSLLLRSYDAIVLPVLFAFVAEALPVHPPAFSPNCRKISKAVCLREALSMIYLRWISWFILGPGKAIIVCTESCCILKIAVLASFWIERLASLASLAPSGWPFLLSQSWLPWLSQMVLLELAILHMLNGSCDSFVLVLNTAAEHLLCGTTWLAVLKVFSSKLPVRTGCSSIACEPHYVTTSTWNVQMHRVFFVTQGSYFIHFSRHLVHPWHRSRDGMRRARMCKHQYLLASNECFKNIGNVYIYIYMHIHTYIYSTI